MDKVLKIIGSSWALTGTANIIFGMYAVPSPRAVPTFGVMCKVRLFVIPGLMAYTIVGGISRKRPDGRE
jgi:hypothetical protein